MKKLRIILISLFILSIWSSQAPAATLFQDDFSDGDNAGWITTEGTWDASLEHNLVTGLSSINGPYYAYTYSGQSSWTDYIFDLDITFGTSDTEFYIGVRVDPTSSPLCNGGKQYLLSVDGDDDKICIRYALEGPYTFQTVKEISYALSDLTTYHIQLQMLGNNLRVFVDGIYLFDYTFSGSDPIYSSGLIGVGYKSDDGLDGAYFDNVVVTGDTTQLKLTLESYPPATLPTVSKIIEVSDINDQQEISRQAVEFALSPEGWDLANVGFNGSNYYRHPPEWEGHFYTAYIWVYENFPSPPVPVEISNLFGYDLNATALYYGPTYELVFHTDEWCGRGSHDICESSDNYGVISGCSGGIFSQCIVSDWGRFSIEQVEEPTAKTGLKQGDFNGDGNIDILWRRTDTGKTYIWIMNGTNVSSHGYTSLQTGLIWDIAGIGDFNNDMRSDILWRRTDTGETYIWLLGADGISVSSHGYTSLSAGTVWEIQGIGKFDGTTSGDDLLWRRTDNGKTYIWPMSGTSVSGDGYTSIQAGLVWDIAGIGDFNNDTRSDILWRRMDTGQTYIWPMNGTNAIGHGFTSLTASPEWELQGISKFDGPTSGDDLLWRRTDTGKTYIWPMNGTSVGTHGYTSLEAGLVWEIADIGDFNNDTRSDILWRRMDTGQTYLWPMNGKTVDPSHGYTSLTAGPIWEIQKCAKFDGPGSGDDILWRRMDTGQTYIWPMNGTSVGTHGYTSLTAAPVWEIQ